MKIQVGERYYTRPYGDVVVHKIWVELDDGDATTMLRVETHTGRAKNMTLDNFTRCYAG